MPRAFRFVDTLKKFLCHGECGQLKAIIHFYVDRATGRLSHECKLCRRKKTSVRTIPNLDCGEYVAVQSGYGGPTVKQFVRRRK